MTLVPPWFDLKDPVAVHGTARVRTVNSDWLIALDRRQGAYALLGPGPGGWVPMQWVTDDHGRYLAPSEIDWSKLVGALWRGRVKGEDAVSRVLAHNERLQAQREAEMSREQQEKLNYCREAIRREHEGDGRYSAADMVQGLNARWV